MEFMMGLVLPIVVVIISFVTKRYEQKRQKQQREEIVKQAALELLNEIRKSLPSG